MQIKNKDVNKSLILFLFIHLVVWTLVPTISNINLPLEKIQNICDYLKLDCNVVEKLRQMSEYAKTEVPFVNLQNQ